MFNLLDHNSSGFITFYDFIEQIPAKDNVSDPTNNDSLSLSKKSPSTINSKTVQSLFKILQLYHFKCVKKSAA